MAKSKSDAFSIVAKANIQDAMWMKHMLDVHGIQAHLWGGSIATWDPLSIVNGGVDPVRVVVASRDEVEALKLLEELDEPHKAFLASAWICLNCGEKCEGNFEICWNCQAERPAALT